MIILAGSVVYGQIDNASIIVRPAFELPLGPRSAVFNEDALYTTGGSATLDLLFTPPDFSSFYYGGNLGYSVIPTQAETLSILSAGIEAGLSLRMGDALSISAGGELGWYMGMYPETDAGSNPYGGGNVYLSWDFTPGFTLSAGGGYRYYLGYDIASSSYTDLYQGMRFSLGTVFHLNTKKDRSRIKIQDIEFDPVFPVFYGYYDNNAVGKVSLLNGENSTISDIKVYFNVNQYMEEPKLSAEIASLKHGQSIDVELKALFNNSVMQLTESTKVSASIITEYTYLGERFTSTTPYTLRIYDRNSMMWDDDRKAASFVNAKDSTVLLFAKNTAGIIREQRNNSINLNFRIAMGIFETLRLYGMNYVVDPQSSYVEAIEDSLFIDYLQFPAQSLTYRAGDCDDLSILYSSLLESVGISTAFITIPGHIYMAFSLDMDEDQTKNLFSNTEDFLFLEGNTWVPVEITLIPEGFLKSWKIGAKEWRNNQEHDNAAIYPVHEAWQTYEPVAIPGAALSLVFPEREMIIQSYQENLDLFISRELEPKVLEYQNLISTRGENARIRNSFGVLYARFGLYDEAKSQFARAIQLDAKFLSSLINMGNIYTLGEDSSNALKWYKKAEEISPQNSLVIASVARAHYDLEDFKLAEESYYKLKEIDPDRAARYAYMGNESNYVGRAAAADDQNAAYWAEE